MGEKLERLHKSLDDEKVMILYRDIRHTPERLMGLYAKEGKDAVIFLDNSLLTRRIEHRCTLFHEAGHHFMGITSNYCATSDNYLDAIKKSKDEYRAMRWATSQLITDAELCYAINNECLRDCYELAEYFDVTVPFVMAKLTYLKQCFRWGGLKVKGRDILKSLKMLNICNGW